MNKRLYKTYINLSNIIVRISDGTERGKASAVLINSHLDSTLPSPGATDDGLAVGVMLECARVLVETKGWEPTYSIIFRACLKRLSFLAPKYLVPQCSTTRKSLCKTAPICSRRNIPLLLRQSLSMHLQ